MTKFVLILHLCLFIDEPKCISSQTIAFQFEDYYSCVRTGYHQAYKSMDAMTKEEINNSKIAIKIECKELQGV